MRANCSLAGHCECAAQVSAYGDGTGSGPHGIKYWQCPNWGRSTLGAPLIVGRDPAYKSAPDPWGSRVSKQRRQELKEAGELSILNGRPFSDQAKPGDKSVKDIRAEVAERRKQRKRPLINVSR